MNKVDQHAEICSELNKLYAEKNADYGDSFAQTYAEEGMAMPRIRLSDKLNRFKRLTQTDNQKVKTESIRDTLIDLANYAIMTVMELDDENSNAKDETHVFDSKACSHGESIGVICLTCKHKQESKAYC